MSLSLNQMNNQSPYGSSTRRPTVHPTPPNLPSIHVLFQMADSPNIPIPPPSSLTLPPLRLRQTCQNNGCFISPSPSSPSSSSSTRASSPQSHDYPRPQKRKQVKRACLNCQKACKGCADTRPCPRCIIHGLADSCVDAPRKSDRKIKTPDQP